MPGYNLKSGAVAPILPSEDDLWAALSVVFSTKSVNDTSYKFGFLKSLLDNLYNVDGDLRLTFDQLFGKFAEVYWNLVLKYGLRQKAPTVNGRVSRLERELRDARERYAIAEAVPFESLTDEMRADIGRRVKQACKHNVVGALFEDTRRLLYSFDVKEEWLQLSRPAYDFLCRHKVAVEKLNYYEWARFLEKVNDDSAVTHLLTKLDESTLRGNLSVFRRILWEEFESRRCFYCGRELSPRSMHVDHFIPWSFIKDDRLWNLVPACSHCNLMKSDRLPAERYLDALEERNDALAACGGSGAESGMRSYQRHLLRYAYEWAQANGYDEWEPPNDSER